MSSFNNMDKVPVKIAENYKPPPRVYQMPQTIAHRIALPVEHYHEAPQYSYDFQLERKVLAKMPEWRRMRQLEREARRERKEKREEEGLRAMEAQHKQMLGAVSYPSAEELSSSDSDEENCDEKNALGAVTVAHQQANASHGLVGAAQPSSFHNILQPTILPSSARDTANATSRVGISVLNGKALSSGTFNYKDFEEDTSSPFDNIELKTINDWDVLAQVLHNTQLKAREQLKEERTDTEQKDEAAQQLVTKPNTRNAANDNLIVKQRLDEDRMAEQANNSNADDNEAINFEVLENTKAALQRVNFDNLSLKGWQNDNIPSNTTATATIQTTQSEAAYANSSNSMYQTPATTYSPHANQATREQQQHTYTPYEQIYNGLIEQQPQTQHEYTNFNLHAATYSNQNYLYAPNYNGTYYSTAHLQTPGYVSNNANNYLLPEGVVNGPLQQQRQPQQENASPSTAVTAGTLDIGELCSKSKSVPDILKELSEEVRNSELRRSRYYSYNSDEGKLAEQEDDDEVTPKQSPVKSAPRAPESFYYSKLAAPVQRLAKNISSMGFPLERVAKIAQLFGADDKKIVEHLIPLSELMDLGFDETKISEALMKFDNNKEKALEYLIS